MAGTKKINVKASQDKNRQKENQNGIDQRDKLSTSLTDNLNKIKEVFKNSSDVVYREFIIGESNAALVYIDGLIDTHIVNEYIIQPLLCYGLSISKPEDDNKKGGKAGSKQQLDINELKNRIVSVGEVKNVAGLKEAVDVFLAGNTLLMVDGSEQALDITTKGWEKRAIEDPQTDSVIRGPREGFIEHLRTNTSIMRRKIRNPNLVIESMKIGKQTKTEVCIVYLKNIAKDKVVEEVRYRLSKIDIDSLIGSEYIEELIDDSPYSIFSTIFFSEKPDIVAAQILEGRVAIFVDGTPFVLTVPMMFIESFQSPEDYYLRYHYSSFIRMLRFLAFAISVLTPALYVALTTYHQELIPTALLFSMSAAVEGVPFPAVLEAGVMILVFEIIREAGVRLPRPIGNAISIVGALVIGESAVSAGIIGAPMVIIIAITALSSFIVPLQNYAGVILRFVFLILAGVMGGFGVAIGLIGVLIHLSSIKSFGVPYLEPIAPMRRSGLKDALVRAPHWTLGKRPKSLTRKNITRRRLKGLPKSSAKREWNN